MKAFSKSQFRRRPFSFAGMVLVGILFLAILVVWIRGWWVSDHITGGTIHSANGRTYTNLWIIDSKSGTFSVLRIKMDNSDGGNPFPDRDDWIAWNWEVPRVAEPSFIGGFGGLHLDHGSQTSRDGTRSTTVNYGWGASWWIVEALLLAVWLLLCLRFRYGRRTPAGFCGVCGYDIRATPQRCPECGTIPKLPAAI